MSESLNLGHRNSCYKAFQLQKREPFWPEAWQLQTSSLIIQRTWATGVNPAGDAGDTFPPNILVGGRQREYPPNIITYFRI